MKNCINCGTALDDKAMFCVECGTKQPAQEMKCIQCGAVLQPGAKFCAECGAKQVAKKQFCTNCGAELKEGMKFCVECGTPANNYKPSTAPAAPAQAQKAVVAETPEEIEEDWGEISRNYKLKRGGDKLYGFVDETGEWVIEPKYKEANNFIDGYAAVNQNGKWGFIKPNGEWHVKPKFDQIRTFYDGFAQVKLNDKWGFIKPDGTYLIEPQFEWVDAFNEGFASVHLDNKKGYITKTGSYLVKPIFDTVYDFEDGKACVEMNGNSVFDIKKGELYPDGTIYLDGVKTSVAELYRGVMKVKKDRHDRYGFVDNDDEWVISPIYDKASPFNSDGLALVKKDGKYGYINYDGGYVVKPTFDDGWSFSEGFAKIKLNGKYGFIKTDGSYLVEPIFDEASYFDHGRASIEKDGEPGYLYPDGKLIINGRRVDLNAKPKDTETSKKQKDGTKESVKPKRRELYPFMDPDDGKWGYQDEDGNVRFLANYDEAGEFIGDYARVVLCGNELYIDRKGNMYQDNEGTPLEIPADNDSDSDYEYSSNEDYSYGEMKPKNSFSKKLLGSVANKIKHTLIYGTESGKKDTTPKDEAAEFRPREVRKVWTCTYVGRHPQAPHMIQVPSVNQIGHPVLNEIVAVLMDMGFNRSLAVSICGSESNWKCQ